MNSHPSPALHKLILINFPVFNDFPFSPGTGSGHIIINERLFYASSIIASRHLNVSSLWGDPSVICIDTAVVLNRGSYSLFNNRAIRGRNWCLRRMAASPRGEFLFNWQMVCYFKFNCLLPLPTAVLMKCFYVFICLYLCKFFNDFYTPVYIFSCRNESEIKWFLCFFYLNAVHIVALPGNV